MSEEEQVNNLVSAVGEIVLLASSIDEIMARLVIASYHLGDARLLQPVISTLDPSRKIEMLKARAGNITADDWRKNLSKFVDKAEKINKMRNTVSHSHIANYNSTPILQSYNAASLLKNVSKHNKIGKTSGEFQYYTTLEDIVKVIGMCRDALDAGEDLVSRFVKFNEFAKEKVGDVAHRSISRSNKL